MMKIILFTVVCIAAVQAQSCCMPQKFEGAVGYSLTWANGGPTQVANSFLSVTYDAVTERTYARYYGNWPLLPGVDFVVSHYKTKTYWIVYMNGTCEGGHFQPQPDSMPLCIPDAAPSNQPQWLGYDISVTTHDAASGSPTVRSYITVQNPTCTFIDTWTAWLSGSFDENPDLSITVGTSFMNLAFGNSDPDLLDKPSTCPPGTGHSANLNLHGDIQPMGPVPGLFAKIPENKDE